MHDDAFVFGRWHRLVPRGGVALSPALLIHRTDAVDDAVRYTMRPPVEVAHTPGFAYRDMRVAEFGQCLFGLHRIAKALNRYDHSLAAL